jgi:hypothetical protein
MRTVTEHGKFLEAECCEKCNVPLLDEKLNPNGVLRVKSFFTWGALCVSCKKEETKLLTRMGIYGINHKKHENCGYWPNVDQIIKERIK